MICSSKSACNGVSELEPAGAWRARRRPARAPLSRVKTALDRIIDEAEAAGSKLDDRSKTLAYRNV